jgi:photosystem I subunit 9
MDKNLLTYLSTAPVLITVWMSITAGLIIEVLRFVPDSLSFASY